ncbi:hypothetical protein RhiJN_10108 [Ceratobasidium sp. AG-Ba]|nr:hypothetical protein RhiJN_10108 [Ceratobasidium sp. AG-Ba]QRW10868.1 hypothetical protein RhiLY_09867 [Ceratobasidium sp. AG-Ba]
MEALSETSRAFPQAKTADPENRAISNLPGSVLSDIFLFVVATAMTESDHHAIRAPYTLASVSRVWRAVALSTTRLWCLIDALRPAEQLELSIERSGNLPIDVSLDFRTRGHSVDNFTKASLKKTLQPLRSSWNRVQNLRVDLVKHGFEVNRCAIDCFSDFIDGGFRTGCLQSVSATVHGYDNSMWPGIRDDSLQIFLPPSQNYTSIELIGVDLRLTRIYNAVPMIQLRKLSLHFYSLLDVSDNMLPLLKLTPNLAHLSLTGFKFCTFDTTPLSEHSQTLSKLETLELFGNSGMTELCLFLRTLDMPQLREFTYYTPFDCENQLAETFIDMISRCSLESLEVQVPNLSSMFGVCTRSLDHFGSLEYLQLLGRKVPVGLFREFSQLLCEGESCPELEYIRLPFSEHRAFERAVEQLEEHRPWLHVSTEEERITEMVNECRLRWGQN